MKNHRKETQKSNEGKSYSIKFAAWFTGTCVNTVRHPTQGRHRLTPFQIRRAPADYIGKLFRSIEKSVKDGDITPEIIKRHS